MANPTTNYGFVLPTSTDLVTDLPADFDVALQGVDTRLKALQPGTTLGDLAYSSATANTNTRLAIGSNGQVLTVSGGVPSWAAAAGGSTYAGVSVGNTSGSLSVTNTTWTAVPWTAEDFDTDSFHDNVTNNSRVTIPAGKAGKYLVSAFGTFDSNTTNARYMSIYKNGTAVKMFAYKAADIFPTIQADLVMNLAVNDYVQIYVYQDSGSTRLFYNSGVDSQFTVSFLGA
jgi:hypothetical protein